MQPKLVEIGEPDAQENYEPWTPMCLVVMVLDVLLAYAVSFNGREASCFQFDCPIIEANVTVRTHAKDVLFDVRPVVW